MTESLENVSLSTLKEDTQMQFLLNWGPVCQMLKSMAELNPEEKKLTKPLNAFVQHTAIVLYEKWKNLPAPPLCVSGFAYHLNAVNNLKHFPLTKHKLCYMMNGQFPPRTDKEMRHVPFCMRRFLIRKICRHPIKVESFSWDSEYYIDIGNAFRCIEHMARIEASEAVKQGDARTWNSLFKSIFDNATEESRSLEKQAKEETLYERPVTREQQAEMQAIVQWYDFMIRYAHEEFAILHEAIYVFRDTFQYPFVDMDDAHVWEESDKEESSDEEDEDSLDEDSSDEDDQDGPDEEPEEKEEPPVQFGKRKSTVTAVKQQGRHKKPHSGSSS